MNVTSNWAPLHQCVDVMRKEPSELSGNLTGPVVIAVRGPSRSGKTALVERLVAEGQAEGWKVAWVKRTHHGLDLPEKSSGRVWASSLAAMVVHAPDRLQVTVPPVSADSAELLKQVPDSIDLVLLETHAPEPFPTILSTRLEPEASERVIGRFELFGSEEAAGAVMPLLREMIPADRRFDGFMRAALRLHGGHGCAGLVLGTRLAMAGVDALNVPAPDRQKRLVVVAETDRCSIDGIQAVTGCRLSKRTLRLLDYGKVAATFIDEWAGTVVRVAVRGDLRERVGSGANSDERHDLQRAAYASWPIEDLFEVRPSNYALPRFEQPGKPRRRVLCVSCGEEVSDGREIETETGARCRPCAAASAMEG